MHIALIYPGITESGFNNPKGNEGSWINHGLCSISAVLKKHNHRVSLVDLRTLASWDAFASVVSRSPADIFGIAMMSVDFNIVNKCANIIKEVNKRNIVVVGGPHPSISPEAVMENDNIDYVFCGEGELGFLDLINDLSSGKPSNRLIYGRRPDLETLPFVDRELFPTLEDPFVGFLKAPFITIIAGRGCIYNCSYCQPAERNIFGDKVRRRSVSNVIAELKELHRRFSFNSFMFHDDCLTEDRVWVEQFCLEYMKSGLGKDFVCQSRPDLICKNEKMFKLLKVAGLKLAIVGFESGSQRVLSFLKKGTTVAQNYSAARICHKLKVKIWANYMLGLPGETKEEQRQTVDMIKKIKPYHCSPAYYTPHPGSRLYDYCQEHNLSLIEKPEDYRRSTYAPKIKGIDYDYLKELLYESISYGEDAQKTEPERSRFKMLFAQMRNICRFGRY